METSDKPIRTLVVGGSGYIGSAICRHLTRIGHQVVFTYCCNEAGALALSAELSVPCHALDLGIHAAIPATMQAIVDEMGGLDALVVASGLATTHLKDGIPIVPKWDEIKAPAFDRMLSVNVVGTFLTCQWGGSVMCTQKSGRIVLLGSIDGVKPVPAPVDYACCKAALVSMVQSLSKDFGPHGVLINLIAPGILKGGIAELLSDELQAEYLKHCTLKRVGTPAEIAKWVGFLTGHKNTYLSGQTVVLDGGL